MIPFQKESAFSSDLKKQVQAMTSSDPNGRFADAGVWMKAILLLGLCLSLYVFILLADLSFLQRSLLVLTYAFFVLLLGLNVMHEAAHGNYSKNPKVNKLLAYTFDLFGISSDLYNIKHIHFHHNYTNIFGHDGDISEAPMIRMSHQQPHYGFHRFQLLYTPFLYSLITITWPMSDFDRIIRLKVGDQSFRRPTLTTTVRILGFKVLSILLTYVLPMNVLGWKNGLFFILLFHLSLGVILTLIFQVAHVQSDSQYDDLNPKSDWLTHQLKTSADFGTGSKITNYLCGGLNFQVIHHLFPNVSYRHYPKIQAILKELCAKHGLTYCEYESFTAATRAHLTWLQKMSRAS